MTLRRLTLVSPNIGKHGFLHPVAFQPIHRVSFAVRAVHVGIQGVKAAVHRAAWYSPVDPIVEHTKSPFGSMASGISVKCNGAAVICLRPVALPAQNGQTAHKREKICRPSRNVVTNGVVSRLGTRTARAVARKPLVPRQSSQDLALVAAHFKTKEPT